MSGDLETESVGKVCMYTKNGKQFIRKKKGEDKGEVKVGKRMGTMPLVNMNVVYKVMQPLLVDTLFPNNKDERQRTFRKLNTKYCHYVLLPEELDKGGCLVNEYVVSQGTLPKIEIDEWGVSSIMLPGIEKLDRFMSVGEVSKAILAGNAGWQDGDVLVFVRARQVLADGVPTIYGAALKMTINEADTCMLGEVWPVDAMGLEHGRMAYCGANEPVGYCWVHLRPSVHGKDFGVEEYTDASTQQLKVVNSKEFFAKYRTKERIEMAIAAWEKRRAEKTKAKTKTKTKTVEDMLGSGW